MDNLQVNLTEIHYWGRKEIQKWIKERGLESFHDDRLWRIEFKHLGAGVYRVQFRCVAAWNRLRDEVRDVVNNVMLANAHLER